MLIYSLSLFSSSLCCPADCAIRANIPKKHATPATTASCGAPLDELKPPTKTIIDSTIKIIDNAFMIFRGFLKSTKKFKSPKKAMMHAYKKSSQVSESFR